MHGLDRKQEANPKLTPADSMLFNDAMRCAEIVKEILSSSDAEFGSRRQILDWVHRYGLNYADWPLRHRYISWQNSSAFGLLQIPTEFADFCFELSRLGIKNSIEIGVFHGASSYFIAAILQRANPDAVYHMVDIAPMQIAFSSFSEILNLELHVPNSSSDFIGQEFDFVFIDADHSYGGAMRDFVNVGRFCRKAVALHDIYAHEYDELNGGVVRAWKEIVENVDQEMRVISFAHSKTPWMGIGLCIRD